MSRRLRLIAGPLLLVGLAALLAGCGGSSDTTPTSSDTSTTSTIEGDLQAKLDDAKQSCLDAAGKISNSTAQSAAQAACEQLSSSLAKDITSAAEQAKGNLSKALDNLASDCREAAKGLPGGGGVASSFCDAISASSGSVSGNG